MLTEEQMRKFGYNAVRNDDYVAAVSEKWGGLLEGIPRQTKSQRHTRNVMAILFENQMNSLKEYLREDTRGSNVGTYTKSIFPVLRRTFPNLIANEIASVQPLTGPVGIVFYRDTVKQSNKGPTAAGDIMPRDFDRDYTSEFVNGEMCAVGNGAAYGGAGTPLNVTLAWTPVRPLNTAQGFKLELKDIIVATGVATQTATDNGAGGFSGAGTGVINYSNGSVSAFLFTVAPANTNQIKAYYYYDGEMNTKIPTMGLDLKQKTVTAVPRRLKALWSQEATEDLRSQHGLDAENEMTMDAAAELSLEIDREIVQEMFQASTGTTGAFDRVPPAGIPELDHLRSMLTTISQVSNTIHKKTLRAPANFIVTSPDIHALVTQLLTHSDYRAVWVSNPDSPFGPADAMRPMSQHGQFAIYRAGILSEKWQVFVDPYFTRDMMLVGLKGDSYLDSGYAWCPYIPLQITQAFLDPNDMGIRKAFRTRYAKALLRADFFGQVRILNL